MKVLADSTNVMAEGEVLQLMNCGNADLSVMDYLQVIHFKTAKLFEAAARLGGIISGVEPALENALAAYGMHIGTAFQLIDDVLDYSGKEAETGKHLGDDLAEGKTTMPLIHVMLHGTPGQARLVREAIESADKSRFTEVLAAVHASGALAATRQHGVAEAAAAKSALAVLPDSIFKQTLLQFADFAVHRDF
jgi:octaprenyl-diphosphate synthase